MIQPNKHSCHGFILIDRRAAKRGFTLIELSIVLIIIGLVIGGVLVGQDLITAATVRAQISQIEKYQTAVNTFRSKYGYLPGDIPNPAATQYGFAARGQYAGEGDGNGIIEGILNDAPNWDDGVVQGGGETGLFWQDLSTAKLIGGNFNGPTYMPMSTSVSGSALDSYLPAAKVGAGNYLYVYSSMPTSLPYYSGGIPGINFFGITNVENLANSLVGIPGLTVVQAYNIDKKIDDGLPQTGTVTTIYVGWAAGPTWSIGGDVMGAGPVGAFAGTVASASPTTCYDNGGNASAPMQYSIGQNNGTGINCGLSFKFQ